VQGADVVRPKPNGRHGFRQRRGAIYTGGAIVKENGRVAVQGGLNIFLPHGQNPQNDAKFFGVIKVVSQSMLLGTENTGEFIYAAQSGSTSTNIAANHTINTQQKDGVTYTGTTRADIYSDFSNRALLYLDYEATLVTGSTGRFGYPTSGTWGMYQLQEAIWYPDTSTNPVASIESNIGGYFTQNTPLLDTYTGAAACYSLRLMRTAYTGSAIRVRRASDNTEQDIGFNVFGELDTVSLASFCSGTNGFVKTWYDQASTNDATQTNTASQPKIYDSVTGVVTENGKPAVFFEADIMDFTLPAMTEGEVFRVLRSANDPSTSASEAGGDVLGTGWNSGANSHYPWTNGTIYDSTGRNSRLSFNPTANLAQQHLLNILSKSGEWTARINGTQEYTTASNTVGFRTSNSFGQAGTALLKHHYQEFILWQSDQSSNRTNIEDNINTFYSIY
jgi:hypothetical protein